MMWHSGFLFSIGSRCAYGYVFVYLPGVGRYNFAAKIFSEPHSQIAFTGAGGSGNYNESRPVLFVHLFSSATSLAISTIVAVAFSMEGIGTNS